VNSVAAAVAPPPITRSEAVRFALWSGLLTGAGELSHAAFRKFIHRMPLFRPPEIVWMTPVMTALLFVAAVLLLIVLDRGRGRVLRAPVVVGLCLGMALLSGLWLIPRLHRGASVLLAAGIAFRLAVPGARRLPAMDRLARRTLPALLAAVLLVAIVPLMVERIAERRATAALSRAHAGAPNVLLIILDTVRAMSMSLYGYSRPTTPELQKLAARGVLFTRAISPGPWTLPSHASIFTGREENELSTDWFVPLDATYPTLAEQLRGAGYRTGGFSANVWYASREMGLGRGFLHFEDYRRSLGELWVSASIPRVLRGEFVRQLGREDDTPDRKSAEDINRAFLDWLDRKGDHPYFAFLNFFDAHTPYLPPEVFDRQFQTSSLRLSHAPDRASATALPDTARVRAARDSYEAAIAYLDHELGRLFSELERRGALENTVVIVTADHGEEFFEHGVPEHGNSLYLPSVHVPLMVVWPGHLPAGQAVTQPVGVRQVAATIMELVGLGATSPFPGPSLTRAWRTPDSAPEPPIFNQLGHATGLPEWYPVSKGDMFAVLFGRLRYIRDGDGSPELYDFDLDPAERNNLAADSTHRAALARLTEMVDRIRPRQP
jgi:arylsulfatase A-like enzyme